MSESVLNYPKIGQTKDQKVLYFLLYQQQKILGCLMERE